MADNGSDNTNNKPGAQDAAGGDNKNNDSTGDKKQDDTLPKPGVVQVSGAPPPGKGRSMGPSTQVLTTEAGDAFPRPGVLHVSGAPPPGKGRSMVPSTQVLANEAGEALPSPGVVHVSGAPPPGKGRSMVPSTQVLTTQAPGSTSEVGDAFPRPGVVQVSGAPPPGKGRSMGPKAPDPELDPSQLTRAPSSTGTIENITEKLNASLENLDAPLEPAVAASTSPANNGSVGPYTAPVTSTVGTSNAVDSRAARKIDAKSAVKEEMDMLRSKGIGQTPGAVSVSGSSATAVAQKSAVDSRAARKIDAKSAVKEEMDMLRSQGIGQTPGAVSVSATAVAQKSDAKASVRAEVEELRQSRGDAPQAPGAVAVSAGASKATPRDGKTAIQQEVDAMKTQRPGAVQALNSDGTARAERASRKARSQLSSSNASQTSIEDPAKRNLAESIGPGENVEVEPGAVNETGGNREGKKSSALKGLNETLEKERQSLLEKLRAAETQTTPQTADVSLETIQKPLNRGEETLSSDPNSELGKRISYNQELSADQTQALLEEGGVVAAQVIDEDQLEAEYQAKMMANVVTAAAVSEEEIKGKQRANCIRGLCGSLVLLAIVLGVAIPITKKKASEIPPTAAPTPQNEYNYVVDLLTPMSGNKIFEEGTPQYKAFNWLMNDDPLMLDFKEVNASTVTERYCAVVGYYALEGPGWLRQLNFLSNSSICNWTDGTGNGILCYNTPLVKAYQVFSNNVSGTLPPELIYFETMEAFGFVNGNISGTLPPEYAKSQSLKYFQISEQLVTGSIPNEYAALRQLDTINLADLLLTGTIPGGWFDLSVAATYIDLSINNLEGTIPPLLPQSMLWFFSVGQNNLTGTIHPSVYMQPELNDLVLSNNRFTGTIAPQLQALEKLTNLQMDSNMLTGRIPSALGYLGTLQEMLLNSNLFTGAIPFQLGKMSSLTKLDISSNKLTGTIPSELAGLDLEYLNLASNGLTGTVPSSFVAVSALYQFLMQNTSITDGLEIAFCNRTLHTSISADCGGNSPEVPCSCCTTCCDPNGDNCVLDLPGVCAISSTEFEADDERGTNCTCKSEGSYLSCSDTACQTCNVDNTVCALSTDYGYTFNETTGEILTFHATLQYVKGRNETIRFSQDPNSMFCDLEVDGQLCSVCRVAGCVSSQLGLATDCRNIGATTKITTCNDYTEDLGKFQAIMWIDPSRRDGCPPMIQISDGV